MTPHGLLLSDDLIFASRITATARAHGINMDVARTMPQCLQLATLTPPSGIIVDLQNETLHIAEFMTTMRSHCLSMIIGYGSHVDKATLQAAREAGFDLVIPRSKFVHDLESSIENWLNINHRE